MPERRLVSSVLTAGGAALVNDGVMANNAPDEAALDECKDLGAALA